MDRRVDKCDIVRDPHHQHEYAHRLRTELDEIITRSAFSAQEKRCIKDAASIVERIYADVEPRNDGAHPDTHVFRVALKIAGRDGYGIKNVDTILGALFHDTVEDHAEVLARLGDRQGDNDRRDALIYLESTFGEDTARIVSHTTREKNPLATSRAEKIADYLTYVTQAVSDPQAVIVKIADVCDNVMSPSPDPMQRAYSMEKYWNASDILISGLKEHRAYIVAQGGNRLYRKMMLDIVDAKRRSAVWKKMNP